MTRYKAYEVLGVDSNASTEDIKTAYAELSKKYHPEENPKEFQQLHEAYVTLTRYNKTRTRDISNLSMRSFNDNDESIQEDIVVEENVFDFCNVDEARKKEVEGELQKVIIWLDDVMYSDKKLDHVLLKVILNYEKREIIYNTKFIEKLIDVLQESYVDDETKNVVMQYIRPWDTTLDNIREVLNTLQEILEKRNKEYFIKYYLEERQAFLRMIVLVMMPVVLMLCLMIDFLATVKMLLGIVILCGTVFGVFKVCRKRYSKTFSSMIASSAGFIILLVSYLCEFYRWVTETNSVKAMQVLLLAGFWGSILLHFLLWKKEN